MMNIENKNIHVQIVTERLKGKSRKTGSQTFKLN